MALNWVRETFWGVIYSLLALELLAALPTQWH
jgi:hypothetical protein